LDAFPVSDSTPVDESKDAAIPPALATDASQVSSSPAAKFSTVTRALAMLVVSGSVMSEFAVAAINTPVASPSV
jgi:hypothetical protein